MKLQPCPLCSGADCLPLPTTEGPDWYFHCHVCDLRFLDPQRRLTMAAERARYDDHDNNVNDPRYQNFVRPLVSAITKRLPASAVGLDFGAGPGPVTTKLLRDLGYTVQCYDPHYFPDSKLLQSQYDFIFACEVIEHFYHPASEFARLKNCLRPGGFLFAQTYFFRPEMDFDRWYYRKDPTHVVFYSEVTLSWIAAKFGFQIETIEEKRVAILQICEEN